MQFLSAIATTVAFAITIRNLGGFILIWRDKVNALPAEEDAWFHTMIVYGLASACLTASLTIAWCAEGATYGQLAAFGVFVAGAMHWLSNAIPAFIFRKVEEDTQHNAG